MKKMIDKTVRLLIAAIPAAAAAAMTISANNAASPIAGQPAPPKNLRKYRKF